MLGRNLMHYRIIIRFRRGKNQNDYKAFVYEKKAGDGTFIYVMDGGVAYNLEFVGSRGEALLNISNVFCRRWENESFPKTKPSCYKPVDQKR
jgi:hypothetical protein